MKYNMQVIEIKGQKIVIADRTVLVSSVQDALDLMATARYIEDSNTLVLFEENLCEEFFDLKTRLAGDILQKFSNYGMQLGIVGDFSSYNSNSLQHFINESNRGNHIVWKINLESVLEALV